MKFSVEASHIRGAVSLVKDVVPSKTVTQEAAGILVEVLEKSLVLTAYGSDMFIKVECPALIEEPGKFCASALTLSEIVNSFQPYDEKKGVGTTPITFSLDVRGRVVLITAKTKYGKKTVNHKRKVPLLDADMFPSIPQRPPNDYISIPGAVLREAFDSTHHAVSSGPAVTGPMAGVLLKASGGQLSSTGTDRLKLAEFRAPIDHVIEFSVILPPKVAHKISRCLDPTVDAHLIPAKNVFWVFSPGVVIGGFIISGEYPDYSELIPAHSDSDVYVDRKVFIDNVSNLDVGAVEDNRISLFFSEGQMITSTNMAQNDSIDVGPCPEVTVSFDISHLKTVVKAFSGEMLFMTIVDPGKPVCFYCPDEERVGEALSVLMPMNR